MTDETLSRLATWLEDVEEDLPTKGPWIVEGPLFRTQKSEIYRATSAGSGQPIALKVFLEGSADEQLPALSRAYEIFREAPEVAAPQPIRVKHGDSSILAMEWVEGPTLDHLWRRFEISTKKIKNVVEEAGSALSRIHQASTQTIVSLDTGDFLNDLVLARKDYGKPLASLSREDQWLKSLAPEVAEVDLTGVDLHGDFKPGNIIWQRNRLVVIDSLFRGHGAAIHDIAQFLNHFALGLYHPCRLVQLQFLRTFEAAFFEGYQSITPVEIGRPLTWLRIQKLVLLKIPLRKATVSPTEGYFDFCLHREIDRLMRLDKKRAQASHH